MANAKEIRTKIKSIQNTQKITRAMEMVAASKMRKAKERMSAARPYADKIRNVVSHLAHANAEYHHPYLLDREVKRVGIIVISTDRGLCGGLNINLLKAVTKQIKEWRQQNIEVDICSIGAKGTSFFKRLGGNVVAETSHLGDTPEAAELIGTVKVMLDAYDESRVDQVYLASNTFVNTMTQQPGVQQLVPCDGTVADAPDTHWDYIYEPDPKEILDTLLTRYIESLVYSAVVENVACEMSARMIAMKSASDNAGDLIGDLQLVYNKARQAAITQELSEIVAGAAAV